MLSLNENQKHSLRSFLQYVRDGETKDLHHRNDANARKVWLNDGVGVIAREFLGNYIEIEIDQRRSEAEETVDGTEQLAEQLEGILSDVFELELDSNSFEDSATKGVHRLKYSIDDNKVGVGRFD